MDLLFLALAPLSREKYVIVINKREFDDALLERNCVIL